MITISEDQNEATIAPVKAVRLRFVESPFGESCKNCMVDGKYLCDDFPCYPNSRKDRKNGHFVEVPE